MIEPTITQNGALYIAQHKASKRRSPFPQRIGPADRKERLEVRQQRAFDDLVLWRLLLRAGKQ